MVIKRKAVLWLASKKRRPLQNGDVGRAVQEGMVGVPLAPYNSRHLGFAHVARESGMKGLTEAGRVNRA